MNNRVTVIAEVGVNHNGDFNLAKKLINVAADAGADYVKFQTFRAEMLVSKTAQKADYQKKSMTSDDDTQFAMLKKLELTESMHIELIKYCEEMSIKFLSSGFDLDSLQYLNSINIDFFKIPSGEITNKPYLEQIGSYNKDVILSTGMANLGEIESAIGVLTSAGVVRNKITVLHCNTEYPTPMKDVNLQAMKTIGDALNVKVGYSDHTEGIEVPIAAVAMGAEVIEKHFTLDKNMEGPDHKASLNPKELKAMIEAIRNIECALGDGIKCPSESESKNIDIARKSIYLKSNLLKGDVILNDNLIMKRPGNGISPMEISYVIGRTLKNNKEADEMLDWSDF